MSNSLHLCGDDLRLFCKENNPPSSFWEKKIQHDFGKYPNYLGKIENSETGYFHLQTSYDSLLNSAEEYLVTLKNKHHTIQFNLIIPEPILQGIAIAVFIANLPITIQLIEENVIDLSEAPEIDLDDLGESLVLLSDQEVSTDDLEEDLSRLSHLTLLLTNRIEQVAITGVNILTIQGFMSAFEWVRDLEFYGKIYRPTSLGSNWRHYLLAGYKIQDESLVRLDLDNYMY